MKKLLTTYGFVKPWSFLKTIGTSIFWGRTVSQRVQNLSSGWVTWRPTPCAATCIFASTALPFYTLQPVVGGSAVLLPSTALRLSVSPRVWAKTSRNKWKGSLWLAWVCIRRMSPEVSQAPRDSWFFVTPPTNLYTLRKSGVLLPIIQDQEAKLHWKNHVASMFAFRHKGPFLVKKQRWEPHPASSQVSNNIPVKLSPHPRRARNASWSRGSWGVGDGNQTGGYFSKEKNFYCYFSTSQELSSYLSAKLLSTDAVTLPGLARGTEGAGESRRNTQTHNRGGKDSP